MAFYLDRLVQVLAGCCTSPPRVGVPRYKQGPISGQLLYYTRRVTTVRLVEFVGDRLGVEWEALEGSWGPLEGSWEALGRLLEAPKKAFGPKTVKCRIF